ncbi:MAG: hypothetical protein DCC52_11775, partial [Chloroflexi bacterium]
MGYAFFWGLVGVNLLYLHIAFIIVSCFAPSSGGARKYAYPFARGLTLWYPLLCYNAIRFLR